MSIQLNHLKQVLNQQHRQNVVRITEIIRRTIYLLGLSAIFINPVAASAIQLSQTRAITTDSYIAQTTAEDFVQQGVQKLETGDLKGAIEDFNQAIQIDPNSASAYSMRGQTYTLQGEFQQALNDFNQAIEINSNFAPAYNNRGFARLQMGNVEGAIADFTKAIDINPNLALAYSNRGFANLQQGDMQNIFNKRSLISLRQLT
jgi:tetratricopeptide (TPR) repeat protein